MSSDELWDIFHDELPSDIEAVEVMIIDRNYLALKDFAHRYKIRLQYLNYTEAYENCIAIESCFETANYSMLMEHAKSLQNLLRGLGQSDV